MFTKRCICIVCKKSFLPKRKDCSGKYCSPKCYHKIPVWNKGLTKEMDERVKKYGKSGSKTKKGMWFRENNPRWKGGKSKHTEGYILILKPNHPFCDSRGYVFEHRLMMEKKIGRYLKPKERVHHLNGIKNDNRPENLIYFPDESKHQRFHNTQ